MGKFKEYLSLLRRGAENLPQIVEGLSNQIKNEYGYLPEEEQQEIARRQSICLSCPLNSENAKVSKDFKDLFGVNYETFREELHCAICKCPIDRKTASLSSNCGIKDDERTKNLEYKWVAYETK